MVVQSVVSRLAVFSGLALILLALPVVLFWGNGSDFFKDRSQLASAAAQQEKTELSYQDVEEEPVVQIASLSIASEKPTLEVLDFAAPLKADTNDYIDMASDFAKDRRFEEALAALDRIHASNRNDHAVKFLEARILSWYGKHEMAEQEFESLRARFPKDLDVLVSYGYLKFYQRKYVESERLFVTVLNSNPDYQDARNGLARSRESIKNRIQ